MLVLSRKKDEEIVLQAGEETITIAVVRIDPNKVRLGITANPTVTILRSELVQRQSGQDKSSLIEPVPE